jgi:hypothetical protein
MRERVSRSRAKPDLTSAGAARVKQTRAMRCASRGGWGNKEQRMDNQTTPEAALQAAVAALLRRLVRITDEVPADHIIAAGEPVPDAPYLIVGMPTRQSDEADRIHLTITLTLFAPGDCELPYQVRTRHLEVIRKWQGADPEILGYRVRRFKIDTAAFDHLPPDGASSMFHASAVLIPEVEIG